MGNTVSNHHGTVAMRPEQLSNKFSQRCSKQLSGIELYTLMNAFRKLTDDKDGLQYWTQDTLIRYLGIPDGIPNAGNLIFKSCSFLAGFPCMRALSPALLTLDNLIKIVTIYDKRYLTLMKHNQGHLKLIFLSFAQIENEKNEEIPDNEKFTLEDLEKLSEFDIVESFDSLVRSQASFFIRASDLQSLFSLLLSLQTYQPFESMDLYSSYFQDEGTKKSFRQCSTAILRSMDYAVDLDTAINFAQFEKCIVDNCPHIFDSLGFLFDQLLYDKKATERTADTYVPSGKVLDTVIYSCLKTFLPLNHEQLIKLFVGSENGFSLQSFQSKVFHWRSSSLLLIQGTRNPTKHHSLDELIPPLSSKKRKGGPSKVIFGVYLTTNWKASSKECFGTPETLLFQLSPSFEAYRASEAHRDYAYFNASNMKKGGVIAGMGFGSPIPHKNSIHIGNVSLILDEMLEYGIFRHAGVGGSYLPANSSEYEERFEIEEIEVWGVGQEKDLEDLKKRIQWEEREALNRQRVNLGNENDDRALLEMAGLIGGARSGGSV